MRPVFCLAPLLLLLVSCGPRPAPADLAVGRLATPGDVVQVTSGLLSAKAEAEAIAIACRRFRFDNAAFTRADVSWTRAIAELAVASPRTLFDGFRRMGYSEPYDRFRDRIRDGGGVPDFAETGHGGALVNLGVALGGAGPAMPITRGEAECEDGDRAQDKGWLAGTFLMDEPEAPDP